jgi:hypothetical protein
MHTAELDMPHLPLEAQQAHVFPSLDDSALLSISQLYDHGFEAKFTQHNVQILQNSEVILQGHRNVHTGLWQLALSPAPPTSPPNNLSLPLLQTANNVYELKRQQDIVQHHHQSACCPVPSAWTEAINACFFTSWPGLTRGIVRKHLPKPLATAKGRLCQTHQGTRSTNLVTQSTDLPEAPTKTNTRTHQACMQAIEITGKVCSNQTGRFPVTS